MHFIRLQLFIVGICHASLTFRDEVADGGKSGNPGVQSTLSHKGIMYLNKVAGDTLNAVMPNMPITSSHTELPRGYLDLTNLRVIHFRPAEGFDITLKSPNTAKWTIKNMDIGMKGHAVGEYGPIEGEGNFDITGYNISYQIIMTLSDDKGHPHLTVEDCDATAKSIDMKVYDFEERLIRLFETYKKLVLKTIKPHFETQLCEQMEQFLAKVDDEFENMPLKTPLNKNQNGGNSQNSWTSSRSRLVNGSSYSSVVQVRSWGSKNTSKTGATTNDILSKLYFDYSFTKDPGFEPNLIDFFSKGETSYLGNGGTPFYPSSIDESFVNSDRMLSMMITDYAVNSMLYHAYQNNLLNFKLNKKDTPEFKTIFKPTCDELNGEFCLTTILPELNDQYPGSDMEVKMAPIQAPAIIVKKIKTFVYTLGELMVTANNGTDHEEVVKTTFDYEAEMKPYIENNIMKGKLTVTKLQIKLIKTTLKKLDQKRLDTISDLLKPVFEMTGNALISKGFPLPTMKQFRLVNPNLKFFDRKMLVETDLDINRDEAIQLATKVANKKLKSISYSSISNDNNDKKKKKGQDKSSRAKKQNDRREHRS